MTVPSIRQATVDDHEAVRATITLAFSSDPFNRWYLLDAASYLHHFPRIVDSFLGTSIEAGTCFVTDACSGAALWLPPGETGDVAAAETAFSAALPQHLAQDFGQLMGLFETYHPHDDDCWYLPLIGVDPNHQREGIGGALMKHANSVIDAQGALGYLEASSSANEALYARYGFETIAELQVGSSPIARPMIRARQT